MELLQVNIIEIICKLEKIFPPSFFDSMEHLTIHLPYEAKVRGPVQYRWMYPFERYVFMSYYFLFFSIFSQTNWYQWYRYMFYLKKKVTNKAKVEDYVKHIWLMKLSFLHLIILVMTCKQYGIEFQGMMTVALKVLMDNFQFFLTQGKNCLEDRIEDNCHMLKWKLHITIFVSTVKNWSPI